MYLAFDSLVLQLSNIHASASLSLNVLICMSSSHRRMTPSHGAYLPRVCATCNGKAVRTWLSVPSNLYFLCWTFSFLLLIHPAIYVAAHPGMAASKVAVLGKLTDSNIEMLFYASLITAAATAAASSFVFALAHPDGEVRRGSRMLFAQSGFLVIAALLRIHGLFTVSSVAVRDTFAYVGLCLLLYQYGGGAGVTLFGAAACIAEFTYFSVTNEKYRLGQSRPGTRSSVDDGNRYVNIVWFLTMLVVFAWALVRIQRRQSRAVRLRYVAVTWIIVGAHLMFIPFTLFGKGASTGALHVAFGAAVAESCLFYFGPLLLMFLGACQWLR